MFGKTVEMTRIIEAKIRYGEIEIQRETKVERRDTFYDGKNGQSSSRIYMRLR